MKLVISILSLVFAIIVANGCNSHTPINNNETSALTKYSKVKIDLFFKAIKNGNYRSGLSELLSSNVDINLKDSTTVNLSNKFNLINELSGKFVSDRLLRKKEIGQDLGVYVYFVRYDKSFYRFTFTFYNNGREIKIFRISFDDNINSEVEESLRLYAN